VVHRLLDHHALAEGHASAERYPCEDREGHEPEPPDLDQPQDHGLAEGREAGAGHGGVDRWADLVASQEG